MTQADNPYAPDRYSSSGSRYPSFLEAFGGGEGREAGKEFLRTWAYRLEQVRSEKNNNNAPPAIVDARRLALRLRKFVPFNRYYLSSWRGAADGTAHIYENVRKLGVSKLKTAKSGIEKYLKLERELDRGLSYLVPSVDGALSDIEAAIEAVEKLPVRPKSTPLPSAREGLSCVFTELTGRRGSSKVGVTKRARTNIEGKSKSDVGTGTAFIDAVLKRLEWDRA